jgi:hypothetical protein
MFKIAHVEEVAGIQLPQEVVDVIMDAASILDGEYGHDRDVDSGDGGYVLIIESAEELDKLSEFQIDIKDAIPEYIDRIQCNDGSIFTSTLILLSDDFGVVIILSSALLACTNWEANLNSIKV